MSNNMNRTSMIISSKAELIRNFKKYPFPLKLSERSANLMLMEVKEVFKNYKVKEEQMTYYDLRNMTLTDKIALTEEQIISSELVEQQSPLGLLYHQGLGISIVLNGEDHVKIRAIQKGQHLKQTLQAVEAIEAFIEKEIDYSYHQQLGYLTSCPSNIGTGLRVSYILHLPGLDTSGQLPLLVQAASQFGIVIKGYYGNGTETEGSIYEISNQVTLGKTEIEIIEGLESITGQIVEQEQMMKERLLKEKKGYLEDKVYRSYGILKFARLLSFKEAINLLSDVKLGIEMGIIKEEEVTKAQIYTMMGEIQPAKLQKYVGRELTANERDRERAKYIRKHL